MGRPGLLAPWVWFRAHSAPNHPQHAGSCGSRRRVACVASLMIAMLPFGGARAAEPNLGTLDSTEGSVAWAASFEPIVASGTLESCALGVCDRFLLLVDLDEVERASGVVEVGVRWVTDSTDTDLDLYVTDASGAVVARSAGLDSDAEIARLPAGANGLYDVWVVPSTIPDPLAYEGRAEFEPNVAPTPLRDLLPNMTTLEPHTVALATGQYYVDPVRNEAASCYPEETADPDELRPARTPPVPVRCLRFDQIAYNAGAGSLELRFVPSEGAGTPPLRQRIYASDGSHTERTAESAMEFHAIHGHWHYSGFGLGRLYDPDGDLVAQSNKKGFCLIDVEIERWAERGNGARAYSAPGCLTPDPGQDGDVVMGISSGWADVYNWFLADQFIDVTGVPDGAYRLEVVADPNDTLKESDETDNAGSTWICLTATEVRKAPAPSCRAGNEGALGG